MRLFLKVDSFRCAHLELASSYIRGDNCTVSLSESYEIKTCIVHIHVNVQGYKFECAKFDQCII